MSLLDIIGGFIGSKAQQAQTQASIDSTNNLYGAAHSALDRNQAQGYAVQQPYLGLGANATGSINKLFGYGTGPNGANGAPDSSAFHTDPGYQFAFNQGLAGVDAGAAARGMSDSGATRKAEIQYGQGMADQQYGSYINRLMGLIGVGQNSANTVSNNDVSYSGLEASMAGNQSNTLASAYADKANEVGNMWGGLTSGISGLMGGGGGSPLSFLFG